jgi:hypothetical protein
VTAHRTDRGHPVRQRARPAQTWLKDSAGLFALRAQADKMSALRGLKWVSRSSQSHFASND